MQTLWQDLRYGMRMLLKNPGFTLIALLTMALGIGANTAIFSVVNAVLLRPLRYPAADRLLLLWEKNERLQTDNGMLPVAGGSIGAWRTQGQSFEDIAAIDTASLNLSGRGEPERVSGARVSANFFKVMRVAPFKGRSFSAEEDQPNRNQVVVVSYAFWREKCGGNPSLVGESLKLGGQSYTVVGIMPEGFQFPRASEMPPFMQLPARTQLWLPIALDGESLNNFRNHRFAAVARLKPGVSSAQAQADLATIDGRLTEQTTLRKGWSSTAMPLRQQIVGRVEPMLWLLFGAVAVSLLIICANIANLLLSHATTRQKEIAIRMALGATRRRIIAQLLMESFLLAAAGALIGMLLALWGTDLLLTLTPADLPRLDEVKLDASVLVFTTLLSLLTGLLTGLAPAWQFSRPDLNLGLKEGGRDSSSGDRGNRLRRLLVAGEIVISLALLAGAGLLFRSFVQLLRVDPGFEPERVLTMKTTLAETKYDTEAKQAAFFTEMIERVRSLPGVETVGATSDVPLNGAQEIVRFYLRDRPLPPMGEAPRADLRSINGEYFRALGIPLIRGRVFTAHDDQHSRGVAIINESLARRFWPERDAGDALDKQINWLNPNSESDWLTIVGVVADVRHNGLETAPRPQLYLSYLQSPWGRMSLTIKSSADPATLIAPARQAILNIDHDQPVTDIKMMNDYAAAAIAPRRFTISLLGAFAALDLIVVALGLYGLMAYSVAQRTREIGIRTALGAQPRDVLKLILGQGLRTSLLGLLPGLAAALLLTNFIKSMLFNVSATDPLTFVAVVVLLVAVALLACWIPARRATKVDPLVAFRCE